MEENIHVAITRTVKKGSEELFEQAVHDFFEKASKMQESFGAQLIRPLPGSKDNTYGILRTFRNEHDRDAFYQSPEFLEWEKIIEPLVEGVYQRKKLHGLEAFFNDPTLMQHPPRWKMAIVTWLGVWPTVFVVSKLIGPMVKGLPSVAATGVVTLFVVIVLAWVVMPSLTKLFRSWLKPQLD